MMLLTVAFRKTAQEKCCHLKEKQHLYFNWSDKMGSIYVVKN